MLEDSENRPASWHRIGDVDYYSYFGENVEVDSNWRDLANLQYDYDIHLQPKISYKTYEVLKVSVRADIADKIQIPAGDSLYKLEEIERAVRICTTNHEENSSEDYDFLWNEIYQRAYWSRLRQWFGWRWLNSHITGSPRYWNGAMDAWENGQRFE